MSTPQTIKSSATPKPSDRKEDDKNRDHKLIWTDTTEQLLVRWGDHAACHQWLHDQSHRMYKSKNYAFSIPIIILSTITGTLNVGMQNIVPAEYSTFAQVAVGGVNIFTGIITTLQNFFRYAQLSENHFSSAVGWSKLQRNITIELSVDRKFRKDADRFISQCRSDYDRLIENSPTVPTVIIDLFKKKFKKNKDLILPDILDNLTHTSVNVEIFEDNPNELPEIQEAVLSEIPGKIAETLELEPVLYPNMLTPKPEELLDNFRTRQRPFSEFINPEVKEKKWQRRQSEFYNRPKPLVMEDVPKPKEKELENVRVKDLIKKFSKAEPTEVVIDIKEEVEQKQEEEQKHEEEQKQEEQKDEIANFSPFLVGTVRTTRGTSLDKMI